MPIYFDRETKQIVKVPGIKMTEETVRDRMRALTEALAGNHITFEHYESGMRLARMDLERLAGKKRASL